jgi:hypothetical protein
LTIQVSFPGNGTGDLDFDGVVLTIPVVASVGTVVALALLVAVVALIVLIRYQRVKASLSFHLAIKLDFLVKLVVFWIRFL